MILYKYMSFGAARKVIETLSLGFSCLEDLNDPFECTAFGFKDNDEAAVSAKIATGACRNRFSKKYGVLSLTRQPLNALMWSHYGDSHQGVVLGFDCDAAGFSDLQSNVIPSQYGEMIYSATKPHKDLAVISEHELMDIGGSLRFDSSAFNLMKRAFLYKSLEWAYEEEVRVVKNIENLPFSYHTGGGRYREWNKVTVFGRPLYCFSVPGISLKEIYLGRHIYRNVTKRASVTDEELRGVLQSWGRKDIKMMQCEPDVNSWSLVAKPSINKS
ncbi:MAG: hypothetical protein AOY29_06280 [Alcanivorax borkumensis]|uniref:DUF2971 domain-containing protein n=1 Tax=Alcanivorax borkumensis (strain ATCC 700651 / DSM 11573 / NCIMB 13689 / SK2) TaxID=393595 RepID=Q0VRA1_ALCBS|nr:MULTISPECIES: DUF2971 domain-containing protein [Alcanivorax]OJH06771.1 MAG: hypothetical protein AOY29_06280 [Alcanivorax borkumensis]CAL16297.1 hypothetical protein predicted by Glimmer/Critica [Alcanivorax borkumensis SK2]